MTALPQGFVLDESSAGALPDGFVIDEAPEQQDGPGFLGFLNQGIASVLGAPVDAVNAGLGLVGLPVSETPFGGPASIGSGLSGIGARVADPNARPDTILEYIGQGVGGAAGALLPGAGVVGAASRAVSPVVSGAAQAVSRPFVATPGRALGAEAAAGAGAGVGMSVADRLAPDNPYAHMAGTMIGGGIGGMGPSLTVRGVRALPGVQLAEGLIAGQVAPFTEAGAMSRARGRVGGLVEDAERARTNLAEGTLGDLSPAVASGDRRLMALEQTVRDQKAPLDLAMRQAETDSMATLREAAVDAGGGVSPDMARRALSARVEALTGAMRQRTDDAMARAQERVERLKPQNRQSQASTIVREELEEALRSARAQERELWQAVPRNEMVAVNQGRQAYQTLRADLGRAQMDDIPPAATRFLGEDGNQSFQGQESVQEVHALYSRLREDARAARAAHQRNTARIADTVADGLLDDLSATGSVQPALRDALAFSRELNRTFTQGNVGRVLGSERTGGQRVLPELTLDTTVGRGGIRGASAIDEVSRALGGQSAIPDYVRGRASDAIIRGDRLSPDRAQTFLHANRDILGRVPDVQRDIARALADTQAASRTQATMAGREAAVGRSAAATFAGANPGQEIQAILRASDPRAMASQVMRQARRDPTGEAARGIKSALLDDLMSAARRGDFDEAGQSLISGNRIKSSLNDPRFGSVASEILTPDETSRLRRVADEFSRIETMQGKLPSIGPIMGGQPNSMIAYLARVMAARTGAAMGAGTSGASLQTAAMASNRMQRILQRLTNDRAEQLIVRAVSGDRELFDALLQPMSRMSRRQESRIIETLAGITGAQIADRDPVAEALTSGPAARDPVAEALMGLP